MGRSLTKSIDAISTFFGKASSFFILGTILIIIPEVIARYAFGHSFMFVHDLVWFLCGSLYMLGGAYTLLQDGHVKVDIVYTKFKPRTRAILDIITFPFFFAFCGTLAWQGAKGFWSSFEVLETTVTPWGGPIWLFKLMIPVGASLLLLQGLAKFLRDFRIVFTKEN